MIRGHETKFMMGIKHFYFLTYIVDSSWIFCLWDNQGLKNIMKRRIIFLTETADWLDQTNNIHTHFWKSCI